MHDDLQMMRQLEMEKCFLDGQIPCRWVPDMGYGFGFPLYNFYPPLPYLVGQLFRVIGLSFVATVKLTFALSFIASGVGMYLFAKEFFGRLGGTLSALFYIWAPYHAVDVYVRGAMNESWALIWFPFILWTSYKLMKEPEKVKNKKKVLIKERLDVWVKSKSFVWSVSLALSWFGLLTSHNLMVIIFAPVFILWLILLVIQNKSLSSFYNLVFSGVLAFGLAAFFSVPALLENKFTHVKSTLVGYYDYTAHFVSLDQLFTSRFWGYGPSVWGIEDDGMPFQIGHLHWTVSIAVFLMLVILLLRKRSNIVNYLNEKHFVLPVLLMLAVGWFTAFMAHSRSTPIWLAVGQLSYLQFPWRFLTLTTFAMSFIAGAIPTLIATNGKHNVIYRIFMAQQRLLISVLLVGILLALNWNYFKPQNGKMGKLTDEEKFTGAAWELQQTAGIYDYLPIYAEMAPNGPQKSVAEVMEGEAKLLEMVQGTEWAELKADVVSDEAIVRINIFKFPGWRVFSNKQELEVDIPDDEKWGRMYVKLGKGENKIKAKLFNTPERSVSNTVSLVAWTLLLAAIIYKKRLIRLR